MTESSPQPTPDTPPGQKPPMTEKERASELRRRLAQKPRTRIVTVEENMSQAPKGVRFKMEVDTASKVFNIEILPDSAEGLISFLEQLRWVANQVGVDYDIRRLKKEETGAPAQFL